MIKRSFIGMNINARIAKFQPLVIEIVALGWLNFDFDVDSGFYPTVGIDDKGQPLDRPSFSPEFISKLSQTQVELIDRAWKSTLL